MIAIISVVPNNKTLTLHQRSKKDKWSNISQFGQAKLWCFTPCDRLGQTRPKNAIPRTVLPKWSNFRPNWGAMKSGQPKSYCQKDVMCRPVTRENQNHDKDVIWSYFFVPLWNDTQNKILKDFIFLKKFRPISGDSILFTQNFCSSEMI